MSERIDLSRFRSAIRSYKPFKISYDEEETEKRLKEWNPHHGFGSTPPWGAFGVWDMTHSERGGRMIHIKDNRMQICYNNLDAILHTPVFLKEVERMYDREDELVKLVEDLIYYIEHKEKVQPLIELDEVAESDIMTSLAKVLAMKMATEDYIYSRIRYVMGYVMDDNWTPEDSNQKYNLEGGMTKSQSFVSSRLELGMREGLCDFDHDPHRYEYRYFD